MRKSCVRFKKLENLPLELIGKVITNFEVGEFIELHQKEDTQKPGVNK